MASLLKPTAIPDNNGGAKGGSRWERATAAEAAALTSSMIPLCFFCFLLLGCNELGAGCWGWLGSGCWGWLLDWRLCSSR